MVYGRAARSAATITRRSWIASYRYSGKAPHPTRPKFRPVTRRLVIIGGGPGGNTAATVAATLGAEVTLVERDVIGGAAHLWDCIPSKAMIATGGALVGLDRAATMGLAASGALDVTALRHRVHAIEEQLRTSVRGLLESQGVQLVRGTAHFTDSHTIAVESETGAAPRSPATCSWSPPARDPRVPAWATLDGERILTTREAYPPPEIPSHLCVIGSGVTGVEFTHMFSALGSEVTLVVSRQQVLPLKDAEVAAVLEDEFLGSGRAPPQGRARHGRDADGRRRVRRLRRRPPRRRVARDPRHRLGAQHRGPRARRRRGRRSTPAATSRSTTTASRPRRTSTRRATSPGSCRSRRWPRCRAARSRST